MEQTSIFLSSFDLDAPFECMLIYDSRWTDYLAFNFKMNNFETLVS